MKIIRSFALAFMALFCTVAAPAQTADEIISKYIQAIGGKDKLSKITSIYTESTMDIMGTPGNIKSTTLNGKGTKQEIDLMGTIITTCYTDKDGWSINPMTGIESAQPMHEAQYNSGKDQIFIGASFIIYSEKGYKIELLGSEAVGDVNAFKIQMTSLDSISSVYFFDPNTFYLIKAIQESGMLGQMKKNIITYSNYKETEIGYILPYNMETIMADGMYTMLTTITKVEIDKPVDMAVFAKPE